MHSPVPLPRCILQVYPKVAPTLAARFREREETVKQDVFQVRTESAGAVGVVRVLLTLAAGWRMAQQQ